MRLLLDTHSWLWMESEPERLGAAAERALRSLQNELWLSVASCWEVAIKFGAGRLLLSAHPSLYIPERLLRDSLRLVPIDLAHVTAVASLPHHHRDPFDRLLVAQAQAERLTLVTNDPAFGAYGIPLLWD
jgi:PIN domain nuclease of toxin-antitoxin system